MAIADFRQGLKLEYFGFESNGKCHTDSENSMMNSMISECPNLSKQTDKYSLIKGLPAWYQKILRIKCNGM